MKKTLTLHAKYLRDKKISKFRIIAIQILILVAFFGLWELLAFSGVIDSFITSSPSRIIATFSSMPASVWFGHIAITLLECVAGFLIATVVGILIAILLWWFETLNKILEPYLVVLNALPKIALGPLIIIWVGAGYEAIILMTVLICIIVTIMSTLQSFQSCDSGKILLMKSMGASKLQILTKLVLPHSIPSFINILKINVGLSWVGAIMGEYLVSSAGLGYLIIYGGQVFKLDLVMASTLILCVLAALMYFCVAFLQKRITRFR